MNYGTEPMTYRYGTNISNTVPAGPTGLVQAYANSLSRSRNDDAIGPAVHVDLPRHRRREGALPRRAHERLRRLPGQHLYRARTGVAGGAVFERQLAIAFNRRTEWIGAKDGFGPQSHFDVVIERAGGVNGIAGDYVYEDYTNTAAGIWGVFRVFRNQAELTADVGDLVTKDAPGLFELTRPEAFTPDAALDPFLSDRAEALQEEDEDTAPSEGAGEVAAAAAVTRCHPERSEGPPAMRESFAVFATQDDTVHDSGTSALGSVFNPVPGVRFTTLTLRCVAPAYQRPHALHTRS